MKNFGFKAIEPRTIDYSQFDDRLLAYLVREEPSFGICLSCGGCTATCSAGNLVDFNIRRLSLHIRSGEIENLAKEIDKCMLCGKCTLVCPRNINLRQVVMLIKKGIVALKENPEIKEL
ncbi:MAG TPA: 4Fe-4S dicluster domain-containing protein [Prolixibacteraceae bacterium]|nr:4Fe-4S dicluster domain-containing protein [Prolixibacteraceae bacterium]HPS12632.1 4Fe-4S dicluster domain-containing protein [Prolixibacteraceae bacterium]